MALHLSSSVSAVPGIGSAAAADLKNLGIASVRDLLDHVPFRYDDYSQVATLSTLRSGVPATVDAVVEAIVTRPSSKNRRLMITEATLRDASGTLKAMFFNQPYLEKALKPGTNASFSGVLEVRFGRALVNPVWEPAGARVHTGRIVPVYPLSGSLAMRRLRAAISSALSAADELGEWLPDALLEAEDLPPLPSAVRGVHFPQDNKDLEASVARLKFDELFLHQMMFEEVRRDRARKDAKPVPIDEAFLKAFVGGLPFILTAAQKRAAWDILQDCAKSSPMNRLLQGDVGSGKTAVAAVAAAQVLAAGGSVAYLAPTEILAAQQQAAFRRFLQKEEVALLTGKQAQVGETPIPRARLLERVAAGEVRCVVGTHALLAAGFDIPDLTLIVIDEQHRFGVEQRHALLERESPVPHLLSMTATPIPRSLALSLYGDLDVSVIRERPQGRLPIETFLVGERERAEVWKAVREEVRAGHRAYVVCPLIDPSDALGAKSVADASAELSGGPLKGLRIGILHGKLKTDEKQEALEAFRDGTIDVLVATTVVEVGVDVPDATAMVILGAERFGLAQLHQLRGRVGRSDLRSRCFLLPDAVTMQGKERLQAMVDTQDGFALAEKDLLLRGAGNVFGNAQSGFPDFRLATPADTDLMGKARDWASSVRREDPDLARHPEIKKRLTEAFDQVHLE